MVCPAGADQSDAGSESSTARRAQVVCWVGWQRAGFGFAQLMLLMHLCSPALLVGDMDDGGILELLRDYILLPQGLKELSELL
ncbi:hypothetical protein NDU88_002884 [Pleurodeles waltl]|uniref:Uncharacterized protein n=1 Tax=Pleurodeles waltl TaxID=8319 RepID=A0AAV7UXG0_PLEWA|nr:hypothetical protein NDU88_002884 [Pleurodeles waltl]